MLFVNSEIRYNCYFAWNRRFFILIAVLNKLYIFAAANLLKKIIDEKGNGQNILCCSGFPSAPCVSPQGILCGQAEAEKSSNRTYNIG